MRTFPRGAAAALAAMVTLIPTVGWAGAPPHPAQPALKTFKGEVSDSQCAMNVHSLSRTHEEMLKKKTTGTDAASCARYCVKYLGGDYVLITGKDVYRLNDEKKVEDYAGQQVVVHGTLDTQKKVIKVDSIEYAPQKPAK